jgi:hypothetical protein
MYYERTKLLSSLAHEGIKVLEIWHKDKVNEPMFFETGIFRPSSKENEFHSLSNAKDITHIVNQNSLSSNNQQTIRFIITEIGKIDELVISKHFSSDHSYIWHL